MGIKQEVQIEFFETQLTVSGTHYFGDGENFFEAESIKSGDAELYSIIDGLGAMSKVELLAIEALEKEQEFYLDAA